jgi:hypothetical protein
MFERTYRRDLSNDSTIELLRNFFFLLFSNFVYNQRVDRQKDAGKMYTTLLIFSLFNMILFYKYSAPVRGQRSLAIIYGFRLLLLSSTLGGRSAKSRNRVIGLAPLVTYSNCGSIERALEMPARAIGI